jgi:hypothetical protein
MSLRRTCASTVVAALLFSACSGGGGKGKTRVNDGWFIDDLPDGTAGRSLYNEVGGREQVVDKDVVWARPAHECVVYEVLRNGQQLVYAAHSGKTPIVVGASERGSSWYPDDRGIRHYGVRQDGIRRIVDEEEINTYAACGAASKSPPFTNDWVWTSSADLVVEPARMSFEGYEPVGQRTRLHHAVISRQPGLIEVLLNAGFGVNDADFQGRTPLITAAVHAVKPAILEQLLRAGATVDATDNDGMTALMHAVQVQSVEDASLLLSHGADVTLRNAAGQSPLDLAARSSDPMKKLLSRAAGRSS